MTYNEKEADEKEKLKCPRCGSKHTDVEGDENFSFLICLDCGFDEGTEYESEDGARKGGSGGGGGPYKRGGSLRTQKRK